MRRSSYINDSRHVAGFPLGTPAAQRGVTRRPPPPSSGSGSMSRHGRSHAEKAPELRVVC
eukprot:6985425-Pyramimonas_sp.AAC.1